ncbi:MAG: hypothetical protein IID45_09645, partial [Planctomycetes bacterium]|nr:hypothetical protein [Planctomycetota bacterium]
MFVSIAVAMNFRESIMDELLQYDASAARALLDSSHFVGIETELLSART